MEYGALILHYNGIRCDIQALEVLQDVEYCRLVVAAVA
jgi:hypothetical protein